MYTPTKADRHIFLYAKGWYKKTDMLEDLKIILSKRSGIEPEFVSIDDIMLVLTEVLEPFLSFSAFMRELRGKIVFNKWGYNFSSVEELIIYTLLSQLNFLYVSQIPFELGDPDPNILPLNKEGE